METDLLDPAVAVAYRCTPEQEAQARAEQNEEWETEYCRLVREDADRLESLAADLEAGDDWVGDLRQPIGRIVDRYPGLVDPERDGLETAVVALKDYAYGGEEVEAAD